MPCFVSWRRSFSAMLVTIWMCTQEWSLISSRRTAFTFATCHQPFSCSSALTRSITRLSFWWPRSGTRMRICLTACAGVSLVSRSASAETGSSIRSRVSGSSSVTAESLCHLGRPAAVQLGVAAATGEKLVVRSLLDDAAVLEQDDRRRVPDRREPVGDDERRAAVEQAAQRVLDLALRADVDRAGRLVEDEDARISEQRARERDELTLAEREAEPS